MRRRERCIRSARKTITPGQLRTHQAPFAQSHPIPQAVGWRTPRQRTGGMPAGAAHFEHLVTRDPEDQPDLTVDGGRNIDLIPGRVGLRRGIRRQRQTTSRAARRPVLARVGHRELLGAAMTRTAGLLAGLSVRRLRR
jgi:hypothetical protein